jgi:hypothetical protein
MTAASMAARLSGLSNSSARVVHRSDRRSLTRLRLSQPLYRCGATSFIAVSEDRVTSAERRSVLHSLGSPHGRICLSKRTCKGKPQFAVIVSTSSMGLGMVM